MPSLREIDNREPAKAKRETALRIRPLAPRVGSAVAYGSGHMFCLKREFVAVELAFQVDETGNAAHW